MSRIDELEEEVLLRTRRAYSPSPVSQARIQAATLAAISSGAVVQTTIPSTLVQDVVDRIQTAVSLRGALALGLALGGTGIGGYMLGLREGESRAQVRAQAAEVSFAQAPLVPVVAPVVTPQPSALAPIELPPERPRRPSFASEVPSLPASADPASRVKVELGLLRRVERVLRMGDPRFALVLLNELDEQVPRGSLTEERMAARATATCLVGLSEVAHKAAAVFERRYPNSVYGARVREACSAEEANVNKQNGTAGEQNEAPPEIHHGKGVTKP